MMRIEFSPNSTSLGDALKSDELSAEESVIDAWFRLSCIVKLYLNNEIITVHDDMGFFFQKWMLLIKGRADAEGVHFMGASARFKGEILALRQGGREFVLSPSDARLCAATIANELQQQLSVIVDAQPRSESDVNHYRREYFEPIRKFADSL
jgi:hypothetical protein